MSGETTVGGTHRLDGLADGGEPYTDEEMAIIDAKERRERILRWIARARYTSRGYLEDPTR